MTIIEPNKAKYSYNPAILTMLLLLVILGCSHIYFYNESVGLKHLISEESKNLQELRVVNAELKNQLYKITDLSSLDSVVESRNLIKDKKPEYLKDKSEVLAVN